MHRHRDWQHGWLRLLPFTSRSGALRQSRNPRLDRDGGRRYLRWAHLCKACEVGTGDWRALCLYAYGVWRLRRLYHCMGIMDFNLEFPASHSGRLRWRTDEFVPFAAQSPDGCGLTLAAIWAVVLVNLRGVKEAGLFAQVATYTKLIPFAAIAFVGLFFIDTSNLSEFNPSGRITVEPPALRLHRSPCSLFWAWSWGRFPPVM